MHMSVYKEAIWNAKGRVNTSVECWGCTNSPKSHAERFHTYINFLNKRDPEVS